jgi:hypothetical protein
MATQDGRGTGRPGMVLHVEISSVGIFRTLMQVNTRRYTFDWVGYAQKGENINLREAHPICCRDF